MTTPISSAIAGAMQKLATGSVEEPRTRTRPVRSIVQRRDEILAGARQRKALFAFRAVRRRARMDKSGPCVLCPCRRTCTAACAAYDDDQYEKETP